MEKQTPTSWQAIQRRNTKSLHKNFNKLYKEYDQYSRRFEYEAITPTILSRLTGISKSHIYNLMEGKNLNLSISTLSKLSAFFEVSIEDLFK